MSKEVSVWGSNRFWQRSAAWVTGFSAMLLIWLTFDTIPQITMGNDADLKNGITKRVPGPTVINYKITYEMSEKRGHEVPVIGGNDEARAEYAELNGGQPSDKIKEMFFGRDDYTEEQARALLHLGKLASQAKNCMSCHTLLGNGGYYAPDLTKAWLDPQWSDGAPLRLMIGKDTKEEAMAEFLQNPSSYPTHERMMPNLDITAEEAKGLVTFLKHMSSIDTNGFPRNFGKIQGAVNGK